jgi:hypothetical protein
MHRHAHARPHTAVRDARARCSPHQTHRVRVARAGHVETLWASLSRAATPGVTYLRELLPLHDGATAALDWEAGGRVRGG